MTPAALVRAIRNAGVPACVVKSDALPQVWTELGWLYVKLRGTAAELDWAAWAHRENQRCVVVETTIEALHTLTLWQIADGSRAKPAAKAKPRLHVVK